MGNERVGEANECWSQPTHVSRGNGHSCFCGVQRFVKLDDDRDPTNARSQREDEIEMQHRARLYELLDYESYNHFDTAIFTYVPEPAARP